MLVTLSSVSGAPGVSSWALALTVAWPDDRARVLLEADLAGGVLAGRYGMTIDPGVTSLVSDLRRHPGSRPDPGRHGRQVATGAWCVPGPVSSGAAEPVWRAGAPTVAAALAADGALWLVDCGRLRPGSALDPLVTAALAHIVVAAGDDEALMPVPAQVAWLARSARVGLLVVGGRRRSGHELAEFAVCDELWQVERCRDLAGLVAAVTGRAPPLRWSSRWRSVRTTVAGISRWLTVPPPPPAPAAGTRPPVGAGPGDRPPVGGRS